ncbi:Pathogenesis-related thaumatin superfamily protein [Euphorbia peplus]|nr:Pathogenesis-related thaumatin superfamily protein [Euphorbia peplus]
MAISIKGVVGLFWTTLCCLSVHGAIFTFQNNCPYTVWPGILTSSGPPMPLTGFQLNPKQSGNLTANPSWSGRIWARTHCTMNSQYNFNCNTGDCGSGHIQCHGRGGRPPASLIEFTLAVNSHEKDFYDISLVDGFNLPLSVTPQGGAGCTSVSCRANINDLCPQELAARDGSNVIACKSACLVYNQARFCCTGEYGSPDKCPPTQYSKFFKAQCPQAYSYAFDDQSSTFTCGGGANYLVTFCP